MKNIVKQFLKKIRYCEHCEKIVNRQLNHEKLLNEILMTQIFHDTIIDIPWLRYKNFSARGAAANYSFLYILTRILNAFRPTTILELGIGQSTKLTTQYVIHEENYANLFLAEHDSVWMSFFENNTKRNPRIHILNLEIETIDFKKNRVCTYKNLIKHIKDQKFDLLIIDGPHGSDRYSRIGSFDIVKQNLNSRFVILIDDFDRLGEQELADEIKKELTVLSIPYYCNIFNGIKSQLLISSYELFF